MTVINTEHALAVKHAEALLGRLEYERGEGRDVDLHLEATSYVLPGVGALIANALSGYVSAGRQLTVSLPPRFAEKKDLWFLLYTRSGLGYAFAEYAHQILVGSENVTEEFRELYSQKPSSSNYFALRHFHRGDLTAKLEDNDQFSATIKRLFQGKSTPFFVSLKEALGKQGGIGEVCFQACQNVLDHAEGAPHTNGTEVSSLFSVGYYDLISVKGAVLPGFQSYLSRLSCDNRRLKGFIEIVISDSGTGIAARATQDSSVYVNSLYVEDLATLDALNKATSIKFAAPDAIVRGDPGYGYCSIRKEVWESTGMVTVRTGRRRYIMDTTASSGSLFIVHQDELTYAPGTVVEVLWPVFDSQLDLGL